MTPSEQWTNWSQSVRATPRRIVAPASEEALSEIVQEANRGGYNLRATGSGHSFVPLCASNDLILSLDNLQGILSIDSAAREATIWAGTKLHQLGTQLWEAGLALENMGDIDRQSLAGAISTGTHGTGPRLGNLATQVTAIRLVTADGGFIEIDAASAQIPLAAARVSLGLFGVLSQIRVRLQPAYHLHERSWIEPFEQCMENLDDYVNATRHFEYFWIPSENLCACKALQPTTAEQIDNPATLPVLSDRLRRYVQPERIDRSYRIFPSVRNHRFNEMEFAVDAKDGPSCVRAIRNLMQRRYPEVLFPIEYRTVAADDSWLSPAYNRESVTISIHRAADLPHEAFFRDAQAIFSEFSGRPHWGKMHSLSDHNLAQLYPQWDQFCALRVRLDPQDCFLNPYLRTLFG